eukprot:IDg14964t1
MKSQQVVALYRCSRIAIPIALPVTTEQCKQGGKGSSNCALIEELSFGTIRKCNPLAVSKSAVPAIQLRSAINAPHRAATSTPDTVPVCCDPTECATSLRRQPALPNRPPDRSRVAREHATASRAMAAPKTDSASDAPPATKAFPMLEVRPPAPAFPAHAFARSALTRARADEHPGGEDILVDSSGRDATREFEDVGHSDDARSQLAPLLIGVLRDPTPEEIAAAAESDKLRAA